MMNIKESKKFKKGQIIVDKKSENVHEFVIFLDVNAGIYRYITKENGINSIKQSNSDANLKEYHNTESILQSSNTLMKEDLLETYII